MSERPAEERATVEAEAKAREQEAADAKAKEEAARSKIEFDADQNREVNRLITRAETKARESALADAKAEQEAQDARAKQDAERKAAEDRGEFDKVRQSIEAERDTFKSQAESAQAELDAYRKTFASPVETNWTDFPDELKDAYDGEDDDTLAKAAWMAKWDATAKRLTGQASREHGNPPNPRRVGSADEEITSPIAARRIANA